MPESGRTFLFEYEFVLFIVNRKRDPCGPTPISGVSDGLRAERITDPAIDRAALQRRNWNVSFGKSTSVLISS